MSVQVSPSNTVKLDSSGNGQCSITPPSGTRWELRLATLSVSTSVKQPQGFLYRGSASGPIELIDSTYTGAQASSAKVAGAAYYSGQMLWAVWKGGDVGAIATVQAYGTQGSPSDPFDPAPIGQGFDNPIVAGTKLIIPAINSPNYVTGSSGWTINQDGTAEFNSITARGSITAGSITAGSIGSSTIVNSDFQGGTMEETNITFDTGGGRLLVYATTTSITTFSVAGSSTWTAPAGVTSVKVECWGGGAGGAYGLTTDTFGGGAGGGGEYAAETALSVTPLSVYSYTVGAGGAGMDGGRAGGNSSFTGNVVTVTAYGAPQVAPPGTTTAFGGNGGNGSSNSIHFFGGWGGDGKLTSDSGSNAGGGGGGSSAGTSTSGTTGHTTHTSTGGAGGLAAIGGGNGGAGATYPGNGTNGSAPGGGGGGGSNANGTLAGSGARGQVRVSYTTGSTLIGAISPAAGTDALGNHYPQGISGILAGVSYVALNGNGQLVFGPDGAASDTVLYRSSAGVLNATSDLQVNGQPTFRGHRPFTASAVSTLTLTGTDQAVPGTSFTPTNTNANAIFHVVAFFDMVCSTISAGNVTIGRLYVDGVAQSAEAHGPMDVVNRGTYGMTWTGSLTAGSHTFELRASKSTTGGVASLFNLHTCFTIVIYESS